MNTVLLTAGVVSLIAAVIGGGLNAFNIEMPVLTSWRVRIALAVLGLVFLAGAVVSAADDTDGQTEARYQRQVLATCNAIRRENGRDKLGSPSGFELRFDGDRVVSAFRRNIAVIRRRLDLLFAKPVPNSLSDEARIARSSADTYARALRVGFRQFADRMPPNPTIEEVNDAAQPIQEQGDEIRAQFEDALTQLAGRECTLAP